MQWSDEGIVLSVRPHGESSAVLQLFTATHGRHAGLIRGARKLAAACQPGNRVQAVWTARLPEQLGFYTLEVLRPSASLLLDERQKLAALSSACALLAATLPEREPFPELYLKLCTFVSCMEGEAWVADYLALELDLLARLGYGLELSACAATGVTEELIYVSPKSGRALCASAGADWHDRLLKLPPFLLKPAGTPESAEILDGFALTGYFLGRHVFAERGATMPPARARLIQQFREEYV